MASARTLIVQRLQGDQELTLNLARGGVYDRPIKPGAGQGATPAAFYVDPADPTRAQKLLRSVLALDGGEVDAPNGPAGAVETFPRVFIYVDATQSGKAALEAIDARVRWLLSPAVWRPAVDGNRPLVLSPLERSAAIESDEFPGNLVCYRRFRGEYWRVEP